MQRILCFCLLWLLLLPQNLRAQERKSPREIFQEAVERFEAGRYDEAEIRLGWVINLPTYRAWVQYYLGRIARKRGNCALALARFEAALSYDRGGELPEEELLAEKTECEVLLTEVPLSPGAGANTKARIALEEGKEAFLQRDYPSALALLTEALSTRPDDARIHYYLGLTQGALGQEEEAIRSLTVARRLDPLFSFASPDAYYQNLAALQVRAGAKKEGPLPFFQDPLLDGALAALPWDLPSQSALIVDLSDSPEGKLEQEALADLAQKLIREYQKIPVLFSLAEHPELGPDAVADALWEADLRYREGVILIVGAPDGLAVRAQDLEPLDEDRIAAAAQEASTQRTEQLAVALEKLSRLYEERLLMRIAALVTGISVAALLLGLFGISLRRKRLQRQEIYRRVQERALALLPEVAERLGRARLSLLSVPDDEVEDLLEAGERLFFHARALIPKLPPPRTPRLPQARAEEVLLSLEEAERQARRAQALLGEAIPEPTPRPLGCFFCARPIGADAGSYRTRVLYREIAREVMVCRPCSRAIDRKKTPDVKMVLRRGRRRHWSQTRAFVPHYDFYLPRLPEESLPAPEAWSELFGDEDSDGVFPEGRSNTLVTLPVLAALPAQDTIVPSLALTPGEPEVAEDAPPQEQAPGNR